MMRNALIHFAHCLSGGSHKDIAFLETQEFQTLLENTEKAIRLALLPAQDVALTFTPEGEYIRNDGYDR